MTRILLEIAGFNISVKFYPAKEKKVEERYKNPFLIYTNDFIKKGNYKPDFTIEIKDSSTNPKERLSKKQSLPLYLDKKSKKKLTTYYQDGVRFHLTLQNALYILLTDNHGFFIHSSSVKNKNKAIVFMGPSGAGKSTIVKLLRKRFTPLSDDLCIIRKIKNKYFLYQHPFIEKNQYPKQTKAYALDKLYFLKKSKGNKISKLSEEKIIPKLIKQVNVADKIIINNILEFVSKFKNFYILEFTKNETAVIKLLENERI